MYNQKNAPVIRKYQLCKIVVLSAEERDNMKIRSILSLAAAAAVALSVGGCSVKFGTNNGSGAENSAFEDCIKTVELSDSDIIAAPSVQGKAEREELSISYLTFKKEYLYWMLTNGITDDTESTVAESAKAKRSNIANYLVNEMILADKAKELGVDTLTAEEMDELETEYQDKLDQNIELFSKNADYGTLAEGEEISDEEKRRRGEEDFDKFLANALLTRDDLLMWQRSAKINEKVIAEVTKDVTIDRSEAVDTFNDYTKTIEEMYNSDIANYEMGGQYMQLWLPEGSRLIKHILIGLDEADSDEISALRSSGDEEGADLLRAEKLAEIEQTATEVKNMLDNGADFDELIAEYSADAAGSKLSPEGYTVVPNSEMYVKEFTETAFKIENVGEYMLAATDFGWHIIMYNGDAVISQEVVDEYVDYIHESLLTAAKDKKYSDTMKQWYEEYGYEIDYEGLDIPTPETAEAAE